LTIAFLAGFLPIAWAAGIGFLLAAVLWPQRLNSRESLLIRLFLAPGLGFGLVSSAAFLALTLFRARRAALFGILLLLTAGLLIFFVRHAPRSWGKRLDLELSLSRLDLALGVALVGILTLDAAAFLLQIVFEPSGGWDTWAIWNLRAQFLVRADQISQGFGEALRWAHPDYPLLIPGSVACGWLLLGAESKLVPMLIAALFTAAVVGLIAAGLALLRGWRRGLLAALVLAATPAFVRMGAMQQADVPLSFYCLAAFVVLALSETQQSDVRLSVLAGLLLGCALWTKNEGWVLALSVAAVWGVAWLRSGRRRAAAGLLAGGLPFVALVAFFRFRLGTSTEYIESQWAGQLWSRLTDWDRYRTIGRWFLRQGLEFGQWKLAVPIALLLYAIWASLVRRREIRRAAGRLALCLALTLAGYFYVYLTGPYELNWWLKSSLDRLFMQLWPSVLFCLFLVLGPDPPAHPPEERTIPGS
jgi:hypothetical protein